MTKDTFTQQYRLHEALKLTVGFNCSCLHVDGYVYDKSMQINIKPKSLIIDAWLNIEPKNDFHAIKELAQLRRNKSSIIFGW